MILSYNEPRIGYKIDHQNSWIVHKIKCLKDKLCCCWPPAPLQFGARDQDIRSWVAVGADESGHSGPKSEEQK